MIGSKLGSVASSAIDISDGFYGDLDKLLQHNNFGANIDMKSIPILPRLKILINSHKIKINKLLGDECYSSAKLEALGFKAKKTLEDMNETDF